MKKENNIIVAVLSKRKKDQRIQIEMERANSESQITGGVEINNKIYYGLDAESQLKLASKCNVIVNKIIVIFPIN